jgi:hypothetical protein
MTIMISLSKRSQYYIYVDERKNYFISYKYKSNLNRYQQHKLESK